MLLGSGIPKPILSRGLREEAVPIMASSTIRSGERRRELYAWSGTKKGKMGLANDF